MTASKLTELAARVEAGSGRDEALDMVIATELGTLRELKTLAGELLGEKVAPRYTSSLDATVALIAERLPGWLWEVDSLPMAALAPPAAPPLNKYVRSEGNPASSTRALLAATLRSLAAQQQDRPIEGENSNG